MRINEILNEADFEKKRRLDDPDITGYEEVPIKKKEPDIIGKVIVYLQGKRSAKFTKLARRFARANRIKNLLSAEEKLLKAQTRDAVDEIFDAGDDIYTRIVDTAGLVFQIAKKEERSTDKLDEEGYLAELEKLTGLAVDELQKIRAKYITVVKTQVEPKVLAPKEKKPAKESINEGVMDKVRNYASRVRKHITSFLNNWDSQFAALKSQIEQNF